MMTRPRSAAPLIRLTMAVGLVFALGACAPEIHYRGNTPQAERLALIKPGAQTRAQVIQILGSPTTVATFDPNTILYIGQKTRQVSYRYPEVLERTIVAVSFGEDGRVKEVEKLTLKDGKDVQLVERVTPTPGRTFTLMQQLLGNVGRFESDKALTGGPIGGGGL